MVKCTGRGLVVKWPGVLSKVQMLNLVLGVGVFSLLPNKHFRPGTRPGGPVTGVTETLFMCQKCLGAFLARRTRKTLPFFSKSVHAYKILFSNYSGDYSYSFQGCFEFKKDYSYRFLGFLAECSYRNECPSGIFKNFPQLQSHNSMVFEFMM